MKFDILSFTRAFPCREYQMLIRFASIRRLTVVEWIIMNATKEARSNATIANSSIEQLFGSVYRISKCEPLVRTSVYDLRSRKLIEVDDFDEFRVSALKFSEIRITDLGEKAISHNYIPSESQTRDEKVYHNLSLDVFSSSIRENEDFNIRIEPADRSVSSDFPRDKLLTLFNEGKLLDSKYAAQQYLVEDLDMLERVEKSELITINTSIQDGRLTCDFEELPVVRKLVKEELSRTLVQPTEYSNYDETVIAIRNVAVGDDVYSLMAAYANDNKNDALFSTVDVYKKYKQRFKKIPEGKVWFVFDGTKKSFEVSVQSKDRSITIYIPEPLENSTTILGGTNGQHIIAKKYLFPFGEEQTDCVISVKEKCEIEEYTEVVRQLVSKLAKTDPAMLSLYALPVLESDIYTHLSKRWDNETNLIKKIEDIGKVSVGVKNLQAVGFHPMEILRPLVSEQKINSYDEAMNIAKMIASSFEMTKQDKGELGLQLLANGEFKKDYAAIDRFLLNLMGPVPIVGESILALGELGPMLYTTSVLEELYSRLADKDVRIPSPWSWVEVNFIEFLLTMDRIKRYLDNFDWEIVIDKTTLFANVFAAENPKDVISEIMALRTLVNDINAFGDFKLEGVSELKCLMQNAKCMFEVGSHFADGSSEDIRDIYVLDTCALLNRPDLLDFFTNNETVLIPAIVESELGAQKNKGNATAQAVIRSIERHRLANDSFGYERCRIEVAHMDLISEHDFFKRMNDPRVISVARYYIAFNPVIITDDVDMRNMASSLRIHAIGTNEFLQTHETSLGVPEPAIKPEPRAPEPIHEASDESFLDAPLYKFSKRFGITAEEISLLASHKIRTYGDFLEASNEKLRSVFGKKQFLSAHLLEAKKKVLKELEKLPLSGIDEVSSVANEKGGAVEDIETFVLNTETETDNGPEPSSVKPIDDMAAKNSAAPGFMKDVLIINIFDHHFAVTEKIQDKKIFRDFLSLGVGIGTIFKDVCQARAFAENVRQEGQYRSVVEVDYADFLKDQGFNMWLVTLKRLKDRFSVFLSFKHEELTRTEILERAKFGKMFNRYDLAFECASSIVAQFNSIFDNNESEVIEETIVEVEVKTDIICDHDGEPLYLCKNESKQILWREDELQYQFVDALSYQANLEQLRNDRIKDESIFVESGIDAAFEFACEAAIPALRSEMYRSEEFLALLGKEPEANQYDIEFYTAYVQTLLECIDVQKRFRLSDGFKLSVLVFDETNRFKSADDCRLKIPVGSTTKGYTGDYSLPYRMEVCTDYASFRNRVEQDPKQLLFVVFGNEVKESSFIDIQTEIYDKAQQTIYTGKELKDITKVMKRFVRLAIMAESMIEDEWLADDKDSFDDVFEGDAEIIADEETVEVTSEINDNNQVVEEVEALPVKWSQESTLYIYKGHPKCLSTEHDVIQVTATMLGFDNREIKMNVNYCRDCDRFFMSYTTYELYRNRYGVLLGNMVLESGKYHGNFNDVVLAEASPLKLCGYSVNQTDAYTAQQRQYIISTIISRGIMSKGEVIRYLEYFININGRRAGNGLALSKWKADLEFTLQYNHNKQREVVIKKMTPLY